MKFLKTRLLAIVSMSTLLSDSVLASSTVDKIKIVQGEITKVQSEIQLLQIDLMKKQSEHSILLAQLKDLNQVLQAERLSHSPTGTDLYSSFPPPSPRIPTRTEVCHQIEYLKTRLGSLRGAPMYGEMGAMPDDYYNGQIAILENELEDLRKAYPDLFN
jgi:hypothetical protein